MLDKIKNIFSDDTKELDSHIKEAINRWNLNEIDLFLNKKQEYMGVPYNDQVLGEILRRMYETGQRTGRDRTQNL